jgi:muconolactone D-isomerase
MEFLVTLTTNPPAGTSAEQIEETKAREAVRAGELAAAGSIERQWRPPLQPGEWKALGLWRADSEAELREKISTLALYPWFSDIEIVALSPHPNDPARKADA